MNNLKHHFTFSEMLFNNPRLIWLWVIVRLYVGWQWLSAGWEKFNNSAWIGENAGQAISGFLKGAISKTTGAHPAVQSWYGRFLENLILPNSTLWSYVITYGELLVGIALILGIFVGASAFFGAFMNFNFLMAGTTSTNPILLVLAIFLIMARKSAGFVGIDHYLLSPSVSPPHLKSTPNKKSSKPKKSRTKKKKGTKK